LNGRGCVVEGPVRGPGHVVGGYLGDLAAHGYLEEEYLVSGLARPFRPVGALSADGDWHVRPGDESPFVTRVIVHRPADAARFNGIVLCEWANVSALNEVSWAVNEPFHRSGYVYASISAQATGIDGVPGVPRSGLRRLAPERYGGLHVPGDSASYDVFGAVAQCMMAPGAEGPHPLHGLVPRHCVALGQSQSASWLVSYINAVHAYHEVFSGFVLGALRGGANGFDDAPPVEGESRERFNERYFARLMPAAIRTDPGAPVLLMQSEAEVRVPRFPVQGDSDLIRVWEIAGSVHRSASETGHRPDTSARDGWDDPFAQQTQRMVRFSPAIESAALALVRWAGGGAALARHPRLDRGAGERDLALDEFGNAGGGVRMPEIRVPTAVFDSATSPMWGTRTPFAQERLRAFYRHPAGYVERVRLAAEACLAADVLLPRHLDEYVAAAVRRAERLTA
jgi:hypothetical protein